MTMQITGQPGVIDRRDELMRRKIEIDDACRKAKTDLQEAEGIAAAEGKFMEPREHAAMKRNLNYLLMESQRLQFELRGDRKALNAAKDGGEIED